MPSPHGQGDGSSTVSTPGVGSLLQALAKNGGRKGLVLNLRTASIEVRNDVKPPAKAQCAPSIAEPSPESHRTKQPKNIDPASSSGSSPSSSSSHSGSPVDSDVPETQKVDQGQVAESKAPRAVRLVPASSPASEEKRTAAGKAFNALAPTPVAAVKDTGSRNGGRDEVSLKPRRILEGANLSKHVQRGESPPRWRPDGTEGDEVESADSNLSNCSEVESGPEVALKAKPQLVGREEALKAASRRKLDSNNLEPEQAPLRRIKQKLDCDKQKHYDKMGERDKIEDKAKAKHRKQDKGQDDEGTLIASQDVRKESKKRHRDDKPQEEQVRAARPKASRDPRLLASDAKLNDSGKKLKKKKRKSSPDETSPRAAEPQHDEMLPSTMDAHEDKKKKKKKKKHKRHDKAELELASQEPTQQPQAPQIGQLADSFWGRPVGGASLASTSPTAPQPPVSAMSIVTSTSNATPSPAASPFDVSSMAAGQQGGTQKKKRKKRKASESSGSSSSGSASQQPARKRKRKRSRSRHRKRRKSSVAPPDAWPVWPTVPPGPNFPGYTAGYNGWPAGYNGWQQQAPSPQTGSAWAQPATIATSAGPNENANQNPENPNPERSPGADTSSGGAETARDAAPENPPPQKVLQFTQVEVSQTLDVPMMEAGPVEMPEVGSERDDESSSEAEPADRNAATHEQSADVISIVHPADDSKDSAKELVQTETSVQQVETSFAEIECAEEPAVADPYAVMMDPYLAEVDENVEVDSNEHVVSDPEDEEAIAETMYGVEEVANDEDAVVEEFYAKPLDSSLEGWGGPFKRAWEALANLVLDPEVKRTTNQKRRRRIKGRGIAAADASDALESQDIQSDNAMQKDDAEGTIVMPLWGFVGEWEGILKRVDFEEVVRRDAAKIKSAERRRRLLSRTGPGAGVFDENDTVRIGPNPEFPSKPVETESGPSQANVAVVQDSRQVVRIVSWQPPLPLELPPELLRLPSRYTGTELEARRSSRNMSAVQALAQAISGSPVAAIAQSPVPLQHTASLGINMSPMSIPQQVVDPTLRAIGAESKARPSVPNGRPAATKASAVKAGASAFKAGASAVKGAPAFKARPKAQSKFIPAPKLGVHASPCAQLD